VDGVSHEIRGKMSARAAVMQGWLVLKDLLLGNHSLGWQADCWREASVSPTWVTSLGPFKTHGVAATFPQSEWFKREPTAEEMSSMTSLRSHTLCSQYAISCWDQLSMYGVRRLDMGKNTGRKRSWGLPQRLATTGSVCARVCVYVCVCVCTSANTHSIWSKSQNHFQYS